MLRTYSYELDNKHYVVSNYNLIILIIVWEFERE